MNPHETTDATAECATGGSFLRVLNNEATPPTRERLLAAAARLFAQRGFHDVGISDIAAELGMTGAALYRHYDSKVSLLVALCERVVDRVLEDGAKVVRHGRNDQEILAGLIAGQLSMVLDDRDVLIAYLRDLSSLPYEDLRRMRRKQRLYLEEWAHVVAGLRADLSELEVRALVHGAIGLLHSAAQYEPSLSRERHEALLTSAVHRVLGTEVGAS